MSGGGTAGGCAVPGLRGAGKGARWGPGAVAHSWGQSGAWAAGPLPAACLSPPRSSRGWGRLSQGRAGPCCCRELQEAPAGPSRIRELREAPSLPAEDGACPGQSPPARGAPLPRRALGTAASSERDWDMDKDQGDSDRWDRAEPCPGRRGGSSGSTGGAPARLMPPFQHPLSGAGAEPAGHRAPG